MSTTLIPMGLIPAWHAQRRPDVAALIVADEMVTWAQLADEVERRARALAAQGVRPGDRVAVQLPNGRMFIEIIFATWAVGATPMPLSPHLTVPERDRLLALAAPRLLLTEDWSPTRSGPQPEAPPPAVWKIIATGGSTGAPKLILSTRAAASDPGAYELFPWERHQGRLGRPQGVMLNPGPLYHNGPFVHVFMNLFAGSTLVNMARFDAKDWLRQAARHRVEFSYLVPTMMHRIWGLPADARARYDLSALAGVIHTAAACPSWLKRAWLDWLGPERVWETYGSTEAVAATLISGSEWLERPGSVGRFFFGAMGQVTDDEGTPLPPGQVGLLWVRPAPDRGPGYDYVGATPPCRDGWHHFGDLGFMDSDGYVYLTDRRTDLIIRGGVNIYPAEIEAVLEAHPDVLAAAVIGLPDTDMGARLHAIVQVEPGSMPDLATFLLGRLSPGKHPASFEFVHTPLRDAAGKLSRGRLRQLRL